MPQSTIESLTGIVAENSLDYVSEAFKTLNSGKTFVNLRSTDDSERIEEFLVTRVFETPSSTGWYRGENYDPQPNEENIAQILFTSGTEGKPKGVLISHRALANTTKRLIEIMEIDSSIKEYIGVPVNYSFGFGRCRVVSAIGGKFFIPPNGFNPIEIAQMLKNGEINAVSAVPTLWRVLLGNAELFDGIGQHLKWIEIGSQYMSRKEKEALKSIFPDAKIVQHYGLTEASRTTFLKIHQQSGEQLESVGNCIDDGEIRINEAGRIEIKGSHLASKIIRDGEATPLTSENGWFETSDLGRLEEGFLFYEGRADDLINCGGIKLSPEHIEQSLYQALSLSSGLAITSINDKMRGQLPVIAYTSDLEPRVSELTSTFKKVLGEHGIDIGNSVKKMRFDTFPTTSTGKTQRKKISEQFKDSTPEFSTKASQEDIPVGEMAKKIQRVWQDVLNIENVPTNVSFFDLGGDSLSSISVALKMEKLGVEKALTKRIFEGYTITEIASAFDNDGTILTEKANRTATISSSINLARGALVLIVIAAHWMPGVVERLPETIAKYNKYLSTLYSAGTPGFATIFGFGVGYFYLLRFLSSPESLASMIRRNALILFSGMTLLAIVKLIRLFLETKEVTSVDVTNAYFSVLYFYFFAVLSIPLVLKLVTRSSNITYAALQFAILCFAVHVFFETLDIPASKNGLIQAGILLIKTKYNYFEMIAGLSVGMAVGNWIRENQDAIKLHRVIGITGALAVAFSLLLCWEMDHWEQLFIWPKAMTIWTWIMYIGFVCILWSLCYTLISKNTSASLTFVRDVVCCIGMLAFPMFIGHELVIPTKDVLSLLGVPASLLLSMSLYFIFCVFAIRKMFTIYYGKSA